MEVIMQCSLFHQVPKFENLYHRDQLRIDKQWVAVHFSGKRHYECRICPTATKNIHDLRYHILRRHAILDVVGEQVLGIHKKGFIEYYGQECFPSYGEIRGEDAVRIVDHMNDNSKFGKCLLCGHEEHRDTEMAIHFVREHSMFMKMNSEIILEGFK